MRVLVAGAAGFLGSHLVDELLSDGHEVLGVDNFYTGSKSNLTEALQDPNFELIRHDITLPLYVEADFIVNMACPASPVHYQKHPVQTLKTSVLGMTNLLGIAKRLSIPIFQASTSEIYGDPLISPQLESHWGNVNPIGIRSCYDEGKRVAETLMFDYHRQYGTEIKVARIFNTYGPRMQVHDGRVVSNFIVSALRNEAITLYGDGNQTRSFCFVSDLIAGIKSFLFAKNGLTGPLNLGNPNEFTISELANEVIRVTGSNSKLEYLPLPQDDPRVRKPDISLAQKSLGWSPNIQLEEGLGITVKYFEGALGLTKP